VLFVEGETAFFFSRTNFHIQTPPQHRRRRRVNHQDEQIIYELKKEGSAMYY
jgi:hypothetical protein